MDNSSGNLLPANFAAFAAYCANVVRYYNTGGFDVNGVHYQSPSPYRITWWGIFNEPNINGLTASQYVALYNLVVPAMHAVDPTIKFVAIEESDWGTQSQIFVPVFVRNVTAQVDAVALHYYSTCNQRTSDQDVMGSIPTFLADLKYVQAQLQTVPGLASVPVWVTENNVNADYGLSNGQSACNAGQTYVTDLRASDAFFAAYETHVLVGRCLDADLLEIDAQRRGDAGLHFAEVRVNPGRLGDDRCVHIHDFTVAQRDDVRGLLQKNLARHAFPARVGVREKMADVLLAERAENGVAQRMNHHVAVGMRHRSLVVGNQDPTKPELFS